MLWLKAFHIIFVVTWFAGLFYLPRLFVYHVDVADQASHDRFVVMERRLLGITHLGARSREQRQPATSHPRRHQGGPWF